MIELIIYCGVNDTGTVWTASAHIITAVIGSGVLSLAWATAQLGWVAGPTVLLLFSFVTYYTSVLLSECYRSGDPVDGKRNYTYMDAVRSNLGTLLGFTVWEFLGCYRFVTDRSYLWLFISRFSSGQDLWAHSICKSVWSCYWLHHCLFHKYDVRESELEFWNYYTLFISKKIMNINQV